MDTSWIVTLSFTLLAAAVAFSFGRWFFSLRRDLRDGRSSPDDLWPPGRTIPERPPRDTPHPGTPPGDDWM